MPSATRAAWMAPDRRKMVGPQPLPEPTRLLFLELAVITDWKTEYTSKHGQRKWRCELQIGVCFAKGNPSV